MMKKFISNLLIVTTILSIIPLSNPIFAQNKKVTYNCIKRDNYFSTIANTSLGKIEIINWKKNIWGVKWTPESRCQEVTRRFQKHYDKGNLRYISTGSINNYNIICVSDNSGNCKSDGILITLESKDNPQKVLKDLFNVNDRKSNGGVDRPSGVTIDVKIVIDVNKDILENPNRLISTTNQSPVNNNLNQEEIGNPSVIDGQWE